MDLAHSKRRLRTYAHVAQAIVNNRLGRVGYPRISHFLPTWDCNLRCEMCTVWRRHDARELDTEGMKRILRQLPFLDMFKVIGGEPFIREDLPELMAVVRETCDPYVLQIITNGTMVDRIVKFVEEFAYPALHMRISLDGFKARHEELRGGDESFEQILETLKKLAELRRCKEFVLGINFNITDESIDELAPMKRFADELDIDLIPGIPVTPFLQDVDVQAAEKKIVMLTNREEVLEKLRRVDFGSKRGMSLLERIFLAKSNADIFANQLQGSPIVQFECLELRSLMYLFPNGDLVTCGLRHEPVGNLARQSFDEIWFSERADAMRRQVDGCPGCMQAAIEIFSRLYGGHFLTRPTRRKREDRGSSSGDRRGMLEGEPSPVDS